MGDLESGLAYEHVKYSALPINGEPEMDAYKAPGKTSDKKRQENGFDALFLRRLGNILAILYRGTRENALGITATILLIGLSIGQTYIVSFTGTINGGFYQAIAEQNLNDFVKILKQSIAVITLSAVLYTALNTLASFLAWCWRRTLVRHVLARYYSNLVYYKVSMIDTRVDNPDQRVGQDIDQFCTTLSVVLQNCATAPLVLIQYTILVVNNISWYAPLVIFGYFFVGAVINKLITSPTSRAVYRQEKLEGDFRFTQACVRTMAESIALSDGHEREHNFADETFTALLKNKLRVVGLQSGLSLSSNMFTYLGSTLNFIVVSIPVFLQDRHKEISEISAECFYCIMLISGWSQFFNVATSISDLAGFTSRIGSFMDVCKELSSQTYGTIDGTSMVNSDDGCIEFEDVSYYTPTNKCLVKDLSFKVQEGTNIMVTGPSGCGKSSLLRILYGLWPFYSGKIHKPFTQMQYLPQRPYMARNCLLSEQITYPLSSKDAALPRERLRELLSKVRLEYLLDDQDGEDRAADWEGMLSMGEKQRIAVLRLLYHRPKYAVLDEATSALDPELESVVYDLIKDEGITVISVSHHPSLRKYHKVELRLDGKSGWELKRIKRQRIIVIEEEDSDDENGNENENGNEIEKMEMI